jgi:DNA-binding PadR family transcriptional regulator
VFALLAAQPERWWYGYDIARHTGLRSGTLYPLLARLAERGYLLARWEQPAHPGRPPRHHYQLTAEGLAHAARLAAETSAGAPAGKHAARLAGETSAGAPAGGTVPPSRRRPALGGA